MAPCPIPTKNASSHRGGANLDDEAPSHISRPLLNVNRFTTFSRNDNMNTGTK